MFSFIFVTATACGTNHDESSFSEHRSHRMIGSHTDGAYNFGGDSISFFAGDFKGDFTSVDCKQAAETIKKQYTEADVTHRFNSSQRTTLDPKKRHMILGYRNNTERKWSWYCIKIDESGHSTKYFSNRFTGYRLSNGWVKEIIGINGTQVQLQFADLDAYGQMAYVFRDPE